MGSIEEDIVEEEVVPVYPIEEVANVPIKLEELFY